MSVSAETKTSMLGRLPLFAELSHPQLEQVARLARDREYADGHELIRQGAVGREFFVLIDGTVEIRVDGKRVHRLGPGEFFGELSLLTGDRRNASVVATSRVHVLVIDERAFDVLLDKSDDIAAAVRVAGLFRTNDD